MVMIKRFLIAGIIIAVFLGGVGWFNLIFKPKTIADFVATMAPPAITITAEPAKLESWTDRLHSIGTLIAIEGVEVASEVGGIVSGIYFESSEDVKKGDKLVQLDVSVEEAELHSQKALLREANLHQERQARLVKKRVTSQATLETATAKHESAIASLERIEALIAQKTIVAPFSGQLGLRRVDKGQYVSSGQTLVWLQALDPIWVDFPVPEGEVGDFKVGAKIELTVDTYEDRVFEGEVVAFDARLNKDSRTLMVRGTFKNSDRKLIPGMFAEVAVLAGEPKELVTVPRTALTYSLYGDSVWVVKEGAPEPAPATSAAEPGTAVAADAPAEEKEPEPKLTVERRFVRVGQTLGDRVAIVEGIEAGEMIVTSGQLKLQPDAAVRIDNADALKSPAELPRQ
jgi:membrane fusion protein (multidrug efflux system)